MWLSVAVAGVGAGLLPVLAASGTEGQEDWIRRGAVVAAILAAAPTAWWAHERGTLRFWARGAAVLGAVVFVVGIGTAAGSATSDVSGLGRAWVGVGIAVVGAGLTATAVVVLLASLLLPPSHTNNPLPGRGVLVLAAACVALVILASITAM
jgi:hypothetical protein